MTIDLRALNRATLARQMLLVREPIGVVEGVRRAVALQAQQAAAPYVGLWNRLEAFDPHQLDTAFTDGVIVKANAVRKTLHAVARDDYVAFREATEPSLRAATLSERFTASGLSVADADAMVPDLLAFADRPRSAAEFEAWLAAWPGVRAAAPAWWGMRQYAPLLRAPTGGPWSFGARPAFVAAPQLPVLADRDTADAALTTLVLRYLEGFGPASIADVAQFAMVQRGRARSAIASLDGRLDRLTGPRGEALVDVPGGRRPDGATPAPPRLMTMWDNVLLAYADRSRVIPPSYRRTVIRTNGDVLPTLLVDGFVVGTWRSVAGGVEAKAFEALPTTVWDGLAAEAEALGAFLAERDPAPFRRYEHWWAKLPAADTRVLPSG